MPEPLQLALVKSVAVLLKTFIGTFELLSLSQRLDLDAMEEIDFHFI